LCEQERRNWSVVGAFVRWYPARVRAVGSTCAGKGAALEAGRSGDVESAGGACVAGGELAELVGKLGVVAGFEVGVD
jgi:hypothetical protein